MKPFLILLLCAFTLTQAAFAQETPINTEPSAVVEVVLDSPEARQNQIVNASIYIRNGENIAGADIEVVVDGTCLRIEGLQPGNYLPTETGGFVPLNEHGDMRARLAANVTDRTLVANGDGIFMRLPLRVLCNEQSTVIEIRRAEIVNDLAEQFTARTINATLTITEGADQTPTDDFPIGLIIGIILLLFLITLILLAFVWRKQRRHQKTSKKQSTRQQSRSPQPSPKQRSRK